MQKKDSGIASIKKIINIINSCETSKQLSTCKRLIENYVKMVESKGVINPELIYKRLLKEYNQKCFQIKMIKLFVVNYRKEFERVPVREIA
jgi:hypothetical protein